MDSCGLLPALVKLQSHLGGRPGSPRVQRGKLRLSHAAKCEGAPLPSSAARSPPLHCESPGSSVTCDIERARHCSQLGWGIAPQLPLPQLSKLTGLV